MWAGEWVRVLCVCVCCVPEWPTCIIINAAAASFPFAHSAHRIFGRVDVRPEERRISDRHSFGYGNGVLFAFRVCYNTNILTKIHQCVRRTNAPYYRYTCVAQRQTHTHTPMLMVSKWCFWVMFVTDENLVHIYCEYVNWSQRYTVKWQIYAFDNKIPTWPNATLN